MEVIWPEVEFNWNGAVFFIRSRVTQADRQEVKRRVARSEPIPEIYKMLIERFVTGWEGFLRDGKEVPFSKPALSSLASGEEVGDLHIRLGNFILDLGLPAGYRQDRSVL